MFGASRLGLFAANPIATSVTGGYALFAGGYDEGSIDSGNRTNIIRKYNLPTDAVSTITATLNAQMDQVCAFANGTKGVLAGGSDAGNSASGVQIITLSDESSTGGQALTTNTLATRQGRGGSTATAGYMFGGWTSAPVNDIKRYTYSTDVWGYTTNGLAYTGDMQSIGVHGNGTVAKLSGGYVSATGSPIDTIKSFEFSTESTSTESYTLPAVRAQHSVTGNQTKWMSFAGGGPSFVLNTVAETFLFSDGTRTTASALTYGFRMGDAAGDDNRAIIGGAYTISGGTYTTASNKIYTYSTDTWADASVYLYTTIIDIPGAFHSLQTS